MKGENSATAAIICESSSACRHLAETKKFKYHHSFLFLKQFSFLKRNSCIKLFLYVCVVGENIFHKSSRMQCIFIAMLSSIPLAPTQWLLIFIRENENIYSVNFFVRFLLISALSFSFPSPSQLSRLSGNTQLVGEQLKLYFLLIVNLTYFLLIYKSIKILFLCLYAVA